MKEKMKYLNWLIKEIMASFGGGIVTLALMSYLLGDGVAQFSPVFGLGRRGIPLEIVVQFLLLAAFSVIVKDVFMTDRWIKNMSVFLRKTLYFFVIILGVFVMSRLFKWFPADAARAWIFFGAFFAVVEQYADNRRLRQISLELGQHFRKFSRLKNVLLKARPVKIQHCRYLLLRLFVAENRRIDGEVAAF